MAVRDIEQASLEETDTSFAIVTKGLKPKLRGIPDVIATIAVVPAAALLVAHARSGIATTSATVYAVTLTLLFAISATYHTPHWPLHMRRFWRRLDHSAIYVLLGGCYTPVILNVLPPSASWLLAFVWVVAVLGLLKSFLWERSPRWLNTTIYVVLGHVIVLYVPELRANAGDVNFALWLGGGVLYSIGAVVYARRWPNPWPAVFGYHEIFHVFVVAAAAVQFVAFWRLLT